MTVIRIVEYALVVFFAVVLIREILIPLFRGTRLFPMFGKRRKLEEELAEINEEKELTKLQKRVDSAREGLNRFKADGEATKEKEQ
jgi:hypothetical protein